MIVGEYYRKKGKELGIKFLVLSPDTSPASAIRENGMIVAVSRFVVYFDPTNTGDISPVCIKFQYFLLLLALLLFIGMMFIIFSDK